MRIVKYQKRIWRIILDKKIVSFTQDMTNQHFMFLVGGTNPHQHVTLSLVGGGSFDEAGKEIRFQRNYYRFQDLS